MAKRRRRRARRGLDRRTRDKGGQIHHKSGRTRVKALRKTYGPRFAKRYRSDMKLSTLLERSKSPTLHHYLRKHKHKKQR